MAVQPVSTSSAMRSLNIKAAATDPQTWSDDLYSAIKNNDLNKVNSLLDNAPASDPHAIDIRHDPGYELTALNRAASSNQVDIVKALVEKGKADMAVLDSIGNSPYQNAQREVQLGLPQYKQTADYLKQKMNDEAIAAQKNGDTQRVDDLVKAGADRPPAAAPPSTYQYNGNYDNELNAAVAPFDVQVKAAGRGYTAVSTSKFSDPNIAPHLENLFLKKLVDNGNPNVSGADMQTIKDSVKQDFRDRLGNKLKSQGDSPILVSEKLQAFDKYVGSSDGQAQFGGIAEQANSEFSDHVGKYLGVPPAFQYNGQYDNELNGGVAPFDVKVKSAGRGYTTVSTSKFSDPNIAPHLENLLIKKLVDNGKPDVSDADMQSIKDSVRQDFRDRLENKFKSQGDKGALLNAKLHGFDQYLDSSDGQAQFNAIVRQSKLEFLAHSDQYLGAPGGSGQPGGSSGNTPPQPIVPATDQGIMNLRTGRNLPADKEINVYDLKTTQDAQGNDTSDPSTQATVGERAIYALYNDYKKGVDDGSIKSGDARFNLVAALDASAAAEGGYNLISYAEEGSRSGSSDGTTYRHFGSTVHLTPADMRSMIDTGKVQNVLNTVLGDSTINGDYQKKLQDALGHVTDTDKKTMSGKLNDMLVGSGEANYMAFIKDVNSQYGPDQGTYVVGRDVNMLTLLDPAAGKKAQQQLSVDSMIYTVNDALADPSKISDQAKAQAVADLFNNAEAAVKYAAGATSSTAWLFGGMVDQLNQLHPYFVGGDVPTLAKWFDGIMNIVDGKPVDKEFQSLPENQRAGLRGLIGGLQKVGAFWSVFGAMGPLAAIMGAVGPAKLLKGGWQGQLAFAQGFITMAGASPAMVKLGANLFKHPEIIDTLGLRGDTSLADIWKSLPPTTGNARLAADAMARTGAASPEGAAGLDAIPLQDMNPAAAKAGLNVTDSFGNLLKDNLAAKGATNVPRSLLDKVAGTTLKAMGAFGNLAGGIATTVLAGIGLRDAINNHDKGSIITNALNVAVGGAWAVGGLAEVGALILPAIGAIAVPAYAVGGVLAVAGVIATAIIQHNKDQAATDKQNKFFANIADAGMAYGDAADKLEFLHYYLFKYGKRDAPGDKSIFDYQQAQWQKFEDWYQNHRNAKSSTDGINGSAGAHVQYGG